MCVLGEAPMVNWVIVFGFFWCNLCASIADFFFLGVVFMDFVNYCLSFLYLSELLRNHPRSSFIHQN